MEEDTLHRKKCRRGQLDLVELGTVKEAELCIVLNVVNWTHVYMTFLTQKQLRN